MTLATPPRQFVATVGAPFIDESLRGYLGRALSVTAIRHVAKMLKLADATKPNVVSLATTLTDDGEIGRIAALVGCTPEDIVSRIYRLGEFEHSGSESIDFFGTQIRLHFRETKFRRVSPRALEISQHHRALWELRPFAHDPQTLEKMIDACPVCNRKLGWLRADVPFLCDKCNDTVDLRDFPQPVATVEDEEAYRFVTGLVDPDTAKKEAARRLLPEAWSGFPSSALFEVTIALASGLTLNPRQGINAQGRGKRREQFEALTPELLALAGRAIIGGEPGFAKLCDRYRADMDERPRHYGRRKELGPLAYITYDRHIDPNIKEVLGGLIDDNMQTTCRDFALRKGPDADSSMLTVQALAKTFGVRTSILHRLAKSGLVPVVRAQKAQSPVRMAVRDVLPLVLQMKDAVGENEAAGLLGLPLSVLPSLVDRGLIRRLEGPVQGLVPGFRGFHKSSIDELMEKVWAAARPASGKCCSIAVAARSIGTGGTPWAAVIAAIISGDVKVFDTGAQRRNIRFSLAVNDVASFVAGVIKNLDGTAEATDLPEWIAQSTAAEMLQVNDAFLSRLANTRPDLLPQRGPGYTPYAASQVRKLCATYIFVPEVARRGDLHHRRAVSWLRSRGVQPAFTLQESRDFGYLRSTVEPLLVELVDETAQMKASLGSEGNSVRVKLIKAVAAGARLKMTAQEIGVPYREAFRWVDVWRKHGAVAQRKYGHQSKLDNQEDFIRQLIDAQPDIKLASIQEALDGRGVKASQTAVWNALERFGIVLAGARRSTSVQVKSQNTRPQSPTEQRNSR